MRNLLIAVLLPLILAACGAAEPKWAPEEAVRAAAVPNTGPTQITLVTVLSNSTNAGAHSGLLIDASQHVLFDPAGTFNHPHMPERNDLVYGVTPVRRDIYIDYHARETYRVVTQTVPVSPAVAEDIFRRAAAYGAVPKAQCAVSISRILSETPGFGPVSRTWFPKSLMADFSRLPGVSEDVIYDDDADDNRFVIYTRPDATPYGDPR